MNKKEFAIFTMALKTYYPKENLLPNDKAMELWFMQLQDIPYTVAEAGLSRWVSTNKWSPSIADIREMATSIMHGDLPDWSEAWEEVQKAVWHYGSYRGDEAVMSLSPLTRKAVQRLGFTNLCLSENQAVDRANFRMIYEQMAEREKKDSQIPESLRVLISSMKNMTLIESKEDK